MKKIVMLAVMWLLAACSGSVQKNQKECNNCVQKAPDSDSRTPAREDRNPRHSREPIELRDRDGREDHYRRGGYNSNRVSGSRSRGNQDRR